MSGHQPSEVPPPPADDKQGAYAQRPSISPRPVSSYAFCKQFVVWMRPLVSTPAVAARRVTESTAIPIASESSGQRSPSPSPSTLAENQSTSAIPGGASPSIGDFNCIRFLHEKRGGGGPNLKQIEEFNKCLSLVGLDDLQLIENSPMFKHDPFDFQH
ncbi:uncharacterized protein LOC131251359 isoform X2 [Magnolia sinica]|uniref:uncharacterized protein LOC131251359 isoform X2 n=1 Tax=Magnolia sinica TaxID=86752 RepID=UPI002659E4BE|nr:uncharacterized protein LOC131251359 isoform X2 [Magnolia sinica]